MNFLSSFLGSIYHLKAYSDKFNFYERWHLRKMKKAIKVMEREQMKRHKILKEELE